MINRINELKKMTYGPDMIGIAPASRFDKDDPIFKILPETKSVICLVYRIPRGVQRGIEEGTTYYHYSTIGIECLEETIMPMMTLRCARILEEEGYIGLPQRKTQTIMQEEDSTNPEILYNHIRRGITQEYQMNYTESAAKCGVGEIGLSGSLLTDDFGPLQRYCFVLTDAELDSTPMVEPHLCDKCGKCIQACPGKAIAADGTVDPWQCAVYYNGANGTKNPFMPPEAFAGMEDRIAIIAGEAKVTPETAKAILDKIYFYPPAQHAYQCSICGRSCDMACYVHLEEKGVLTKKFKTPFRKREVWQFSVEDFRK